MTARRERIDGRGPAMEAGMYSICFSVGAADSGPEGDLDGAWVRDRDAGMYTASESSGFLLALEVGARET